MTEVKYNAIFTIVDRLTKQVYFISFLKEAEAEETAYIFHKYVTENHEILKETILN